MLTFSAPDGETRKALIRDEIAARLKEMGPAGLVRHALDKIGYTWGEGALTKRLYGDLSGISCV